MMQYLHGKEGEVEAVCSLVEGRGGEEGALVQKSLEELNSRWAKLDQQVLEIWAHFPWRSSNCSKEDLNDLLLSLKWS